MKRTIIFFIRILTLVGMLLTPGLSGHLFSSDPVDEVSVDTGKKLRVNPKRIEQRSFLDSGKIDIGVVQGILGILFD